MLILSAVLGLSTKQVDYTAAFCQAPIDTIVLVEMPRGFRVAGKCLRLRRSLYGLRQSPKNFFERLRANLIKAGFKPCESDPCLFVSATVVCVTYVDDYLFFSKTDDEIDKAIQRLRNLDMALEYEDEVAGFLGVLMKRHADGRIEMTQTGLIDRVIRALGLDTATAVSTPAEPVALGPDTDGAQPNETYSYGSVVGMLMYLAANTRPDITFVVHQCARYTHKTRASHERALKRIGRYLIGTRDKGLILSPLADISLNCFVDADFAGLWGTDDPNSADCVKSRIGFVFMLADCPCIWTSKLQTEVALSTMQAE